METWEAIVQRRSIRKFLDRELSREEIERILVAANLAPSSKNRQPWRFVVVQGEAKQGMLQAMKQGIENEKTEKGLLPGSIRFLSGAEYTAQIMEQAPVTILVLNPLHQGLQLPDTEEDWFFDCANHQSVGAAIQNMHLAATSMGLGSLWICDLFFAYRELCTWLGTKDQLLAAVALGYPDEHPYARPRRNLESIIQWMD